MVGTGGLAHSLATSLSRAPRLKLSCDCRNWATKLPPATVVLLFSQTGDGAELRVDLLCLDKEFWCPVGSRDSEVLYGESDLYWENKEEGREGDGNSTARNKEAERSVKKEE
ncbi:hypothetical protein NDU88_000805 [Pleurodeles waltl]|uniref:Uncharacterized protein n=1 Tax=Pleurodeles waltl TaxID=8319 RepID=A0AAV7TI99_PLEWA|nr:hypothetical protein NDU88_000805 [Pleurodeles waltl]